MSSIHNFSSKRFEVRFASLFRPGRALSFPCDHEGCVNLASLPDQARQNYLSARAQVGKEYSTPTVQAAAPEGPTRH